MQPRLQEKKVLSIDSGGNFRFFPELGAAQQASNSVAPSTSHTHNQVIRNYEEEKQYRSNNIFLFEKLFFSKQLER